ncbi:MAG TPA: SIMPL domain-containing protein [Gemmatimonadaceae bacterium]|nr:SIMPL domain-containing protein [Gemmatimonadaceae bacterium]
MRPPIRCALALLTAVATAHAQEPIATPGATSVLVVSGSASATIPADKAFVRIAVETRAPTAAAAGVRNAQTLLAVLAALRDVGVDSTGIVTAGYTVAVHWRPGENGRPAREDGYLARNAVRVELAALDRVGAVIDAALGAGANRIDGVHFVATGSDSARRSVLEQAALAARRDAESLARATGGRLGRLLEMSTSPPFRGGLGDSLSSVHLQMGYVQTEIPPPEIAVYATVYARWEYQSPR